MNIQMVDLKGQYQKIKTEIDAEIGKVIDQTAFINGSQVKEFSKNLANYLDVKYVIPCGNGTDALQIALMSLDLQRNDEIILPAFTYVATAEVVALLGLTPVLVDVFDDSFNIRPEQVQKAITPKTKAIVPVHLFGQSADIEQLRNIAEKYNLRIIEDNAQALGAEYTFSDKTTKKTGTIGDIGCTSFFPSKNLGCYGDGGAIFTNNDQLGQKIQMIANHGQNKKYYHKYIGVNSRLDSIQAAILNVKLRYLDIYSQARQKAAMYYSENLGKISEIETPIISDFSTHVFHQYTLKIADNRRDDLKKHLNDNGIPVNIYYPMPLSKQEAFANLVKTSCDLSTTNKLCNSVLSLPMHTELTKDQQDFIINSIKKFYNKK